MILLLQIQVFAENKLFLKQHEQQAINEALRIKEERQSTSESLHLQGIVYIDDTNWTLWINGKKYSNEFPTSWSELRLVQVNDDNIELTKHGLPYKLDVDEKYTPNKNQSNSS